jgi:hypothetical protein
MPDEEVTVSPLGAVEPASGSPALVVIGDVVGVRALLAVRRFAA